MSYDVSPASHYIVRKGYTLNFFRKGTAVCSNENWDECKVGAMRSSSYAAQCTVKSPALLKELEPLLDAVFASGCRYRSKQLLDLLKAGE